MSEDAAKDETAQQRTFREERLAKIDRALVEDVESLRVDSNCAISPDDINDYFDPLDRPGLIDIEGGAQKFGHAIIILPGIRDEDFWTKRVAKIIKQTSKASGQTIGPLFLRAPTPSYGFFSILDFVRPWTRERQSLWLLDRYAEVRDCLSAAKISFVGHSNGTFLAAQALELCPAMRLRHIYFAGSVLRTDYQWPDHADQVSGIVLNVAGRADGVVAVLPGAIQRLSLLNWLGVGGAGFRGFEFSEPERSSKGADGRTRPASWLFNRQVDGEHGGGKDEGLWDEIAGFVVDMEVPSG